MTNHVRSRYVWMVETNNHVQYRAELWLSPYNGTRIASTRWTTKAQAVRDGKRIFAAFRRSK